MPRDASRNKAEYRPHEYIPGTHHQAWSPNDDYYQRPYKSSVGGGNQILFEIVDVVCADGEEMYVLVDWTHYTGGCGKEPPGVDPYTGYITVYDSCVLAYYTTDFLLGPAEGAGVTGRATYWYPRSDGYGNCTPRWIVDSICGTPECS